MAGNRSGMRRILPVVLLILLLVPLFCACGQATDTSGLSGTWILESAENGTVTMPDSTVRSNRLRLRLDPDGSGILFAEGALSNGMNGRIRWRYEDGILSLQTGSVLLTGSVENRTLSLQPSDGETVLRLRDDCRRFDLREQAERWSLDPEHPEENIGIRLVLRVAKDIAYTNTMKTNNLIITI